MGVFRSPPVRAATSTRTGTCSDKAKTVVALPPSEPVTVWDWSVAEPVMWCGTDEGISSRMTLMTPPRALPP